MPAATLFGTSSSPAARRNLSSPSSQCPSPSYSVTTSSAAAAPSSSSSHLLQVDRVALLIDKCNSVNHLLQIHAALLRRGLNQHPVLNFKLQRSYSSFGRLDYSVSLFDRTDNPNVFLWTAIIHAHTQCGLSEQALLYYVQMLSQSIQPNAFTFSSVLRGCSLKSCRALHSQVIKFSFDSDLYVSTGLLDAYARGGDVMSAKQLFDSMPEKSLVSLTAMLTCYAKHGHIQEARVLFEEMEERDVVCWNVMVDGYAQHGYPKESLSLFRQMLAAKVKPNEITVLSILSSCGQLGSLESGRWLHSYTENNGIQINVRVGTALVDMYCKCGSLDDARKVFDKMHDKDVVAWNSIIMGYAIHGFSEEAFRMFDMMCSIGLQPTDITFIAILTACGHSGLVCKGWSFFNSMKNEYNIEPKIEHFGCMVNILGRAGQVREAYDLVRNMKIDPDPVLWGTLLWACRLHNEVSLGEEIAEFLVSYNLAGAGTYVLLSNIYAAAGNWDGVAKVRSLMKESGVEKEPGCSVIEVDNKVHEFLAGDLRHPKSKEIYLMLEEMNSWLEANGYTPQTGVVLHDLGERQKQLSLEVHSEKLAMAFGLISTRAGTTVKIVKNLRVCLDCHAVMKLISKITKRKIIMRDRNRFHHFENGSCSCGDFW
ncbi:pentatricopeptide repeat-containing protein ELI1, chloroplastic [Prosopis cineraria]|uniref:pentatricopeptide repeat-containing protein ELI1, chloroplastic n=1 Tax=Prosopis cineraria TaxID=364024 RepID=UPI0024107CAF|nr:pentatricopeptide repeat-containing protein ELI1, chloroplastic [Prosopis cineraria]